jgi:hypothetical protein
MTVPTHDATIRRRSCAGVFSIILVQPISIGEANVRSLASTLYPAIMLDFAFSGNGAVAMSNRA